MLSYFKPLKYDDYTLSIDNIVCDYHFHPKQIDNLMRLLDRIGFKYCCEVTHWESLKIGTFKLQFSIEVGDGNSFWIGCGLNQGKTNFGTVRIEYNPNKVAKYDCFREMLGYLNSNCSPLHTQIRRYDLAIDYPCLRENCFLIKDSRVYSEISYSEKDRTQYLGKKNSSTYVKLYNKQIESKLVRPLTRLELTLDPKQCYDDINFPTVYCINDLQVAFSELKVSETERFILNSLLNNVGDISTLGRYMRVKMEKMLNIELGYITKFSLSKEHYSAIYFQLKNFLDYPFKHLDEQETSMDFLKDYVFEPPKEVIFEEVDLDIMDIFESSDENED